MSTRRPVPSGTYSSSKTGVILGSVESYTASLSRFTSSSCGTPRMASFRPTTRSATPKTTVPPPPFAMQTAISTASRTDVVSTSPVVLGTGFLPTPDGCCGLAGGALGGKRVVEVVPAVAGFGGRTMSR